MNYNGAKQLNLLRSMPFNSLKTCLFGAKNNRHLKTNLMTVYGDKLTENEVEDLFLAQLRGNKNLLKNIKTSKNFKLNKYEINNPHRKLKLTLVKFLFLIKFNSSMWWSHWFVNF